MLVIKRTRVRNFRSLRDVTLDGLLDFSPIIGTNGCGKSNVLRALSSFFTGEIEPMVPIDLSRDFYTPGKPLKEKKRISVEVDFDFSGGFNNHRKEIKALLSQHGTKSGITIERTWSYDEALSGIVVDSFRAGTDTEQLVEISPHLLPSVTRLLRSVRFRYVPNHIRPDEVLSNELQQLRRAIVKSLKARKAYQSGEVGKALQELSNVTVELIGPIGQHIGRHATEVESVTPDLPADFAQLAFDVGVLATDRTGANRLPVLQGSGTQSFLLYQVLDLLDRTSFGVDFGWTKAVVWALEEPESFLHSGLRAVLAQDLLQQSQSVANRRQILFTTHDDDFVASSKRAWFVSLDKGISSVASYNASEALRKSSRSRVSVMRHPLLGWPDDPVVLVEGKFDVVYLQAALKASGIRPRWRLIDSASLDVDANSTGGSGLLQYLNQSQNALASRPPRSPIVVVRDWDEEGKLGDYKKALKAHNYSAVMAAPETLCNPHLGRRFKGIERYLDTSFIESFFGEDALMPESLKSKYPLRVDANTLKNKKSALAKRFVDDSIAAGPHLVDLARSIDNFVSSTIASIPVDAFLDDV